MTVPSEPSRRGWLDKRLDLQGIRRALLDRDVPDRLTWWHTLGRATLKVFLVQLVTGVPLATCSAASPRPASRPYPSLPVPPFFCFAAPCVYAPARSDSGLRLRSSASLSAWLRPPPCRCMGPLIFLRASYFRIDMLGAMPVPVAIKMMGLVLCSRR